MEDEAWLRVLGPVQVRDAGGWQSPSGPQPRLLLAFLALSAGQVVPGGDLVDVLWDEQPPRTARASLQIVITRLRKALASVPDCTIERYGEGYRLHLSPELVDVHRFRSQVAAARRAADHQDAIAVLGQALALWRGPAVADVPGTLRVESIRSGLSEEHLSAAQDRYGRLLAAGRQSEAAAEIPLMLARHPLAEGLAGMLMTAWYRCGRQADALQVFRDLRERLVRELGVEPGDELQRLHQRMLSGDPALARPADPAAGHPAANGRSRVNGSFSATAAVVPQQLPATPANFAGRQRELQSLTRWLDSGIAGGESLTIAIGGTAGAGKTALALRWAHQVRQRFPDGHLYVNLRGFDGSRAPVMPAEAIGEFLESLGVAPDRIPARLEARAGLYRSMLAGRRMLIVLDNALDDAQVRPLLPGSPGCLVLVTSRRELAGLVATEGARPLMLDVLTEREAGQLLASRLGGRAEAEAEAVTELIALCARLPLALAITAARAATRPTFPLASLAASLRGSRHRLDELNAGDRAASVRAVFSWSYRLLSEPAAQMFRLLGAHPGPDISHAAAASLAGVPGHAAHAALGELAMASLIQEHAPGRFTLQDLLRAYAADLGDEDERRLALHRVLDHYLHTANAATGLAYPASAKITLNAPSPGSAPGRITDPGQALAWLRSEHHALMSATASAAQAGFDTHAWQLPALLREHCARRGHYQDLAQTQRIAITSAARLGDHAAQALAHRGLADALTHLGAGADARRHLHNAQKLYRVLDDQAGQAACQCGMSRLAEAQGDHARSLSHARRALRLYRAVGDLAGQATAMNGVGWDYALLGDGQRALSYCTLALELHRETGNRFGEAMTLDSIGYCHHLAGRHSEAIAHYQRALSAYADTGDRYLRAHTLIRLGESHNAREHHEAGRDLWRQALTILEDLHHPDAESLKARLADVGHVA